MPLVLPRQQLKALAETNTPEEFAQLVHQHIGDLAKITVALNRVLTAVYIGSEKTAGGVYKPQSAAEEDVYQGKVALVLKCGPSAFKDDSQTSFWGLDVRPGMWVTFRIGNSSQIEVNRIPCRLVMDHHVEMVFADPRMVTS